MCKKYYLNIVYIKKVVTLVTFNNRYLINLDMTGFSAVTVFLKSSDQTVTLIQKR